MTFIASTAFPHNEVSAENPTPISFPKFTFIFKNTREMANPQNSSPFSLPESCLPALALSLWYALSTALCLQLGGELLAQRLFATVSLGDVHTKLASPPRSLSREHQQFQICNLISKSSSCASATSKCSQPRWAWLSPSWLLCNFSCRLLDIYLALKLTSLGQQKWRSFFLDLFVLVYVQLWLEATST